MRHSHPARITSFSRPRYNGLRLLHGLLRFPRSCDWYVHRPRRADHVINKNAALYFTRHIWVQHLPYSIQDFSLSDLRDKTIRYTPLADTFDGDIESGLTSEQFDLHANTAGGDSRSGLDDEAKSEILKIMNGSMLRGKTTFDEARRIYMERTLMRQGIGADGLPNDPKFVSFSR